MNTEYVRPVRGPASSIPSSVSLVASGTSSIQSDRHHGS